MKRLSPITSVLGGLLAVYIFLFILAHREPWRDPGSMFFDPDAAYRPRYSAQRQRQAEAFVSNFENESHISELSDLNKRPRSFCVGVPSTSRHGASYLPTTIGSLLDSVTLAERLDIVLYVLIAETDPFSHPSYNETWLRGLVDEVVTYDGISESFRAHLKSLEGDKEGFREKALFDYGYILKKCYETGAQYVAMLEDDVVAAERWYEVVENALHDLDGRDCEISSDTLLYFADGLETGLYLRMFFTEAFMGWNAEDWLGHTIWSVLFILVSTLAVRFIHFRLRYLHEALSLRSTTAIATLYAASLVVLFFTSDRLTVAPLRKGTIPMDDYGCCAQGLVFPRGKIESLLQWYKESHVGFVDVLTEQYASAHNEHRWALNPSVLQHVGAKSSKPAEFGGWGRSEMQRIWSFGFEDSGKRTRERSLVWTRS